MYPAASNPTEIADLLEAAYCQDRHQGGPGLSAAERTALADYLGCHEDAWAEAWGKRWQYGFRSHTAQQLTERKLPEPGYLGNA